MESTTPLFFKRYSIKKYQHDSLSLSRSNIWTRWVLPILKLINFRKLWVLTAKQWIRKLFLRQVFYFFFQKLVHLSIKCVKVGGVSCFLNNHTKMYTLIIEQPYSYCEKIRWAFLSLWITNIVAKCFTQDPSITWRHSVN